MIIERRLQIFLFLAMLIVFAVLSSASFSWKDCMFLLLLCCALLASRMPTKPSLFTFRIPLTAAFLFLSIRLPSGIPGTEVIAGSEGLSALVHLILAVIAIIILVSFLVRQRTDASIEFELSDIVAFIIFFIVLWYGSLAIVLALIVKLPVVLNPRVFSCFSTAIFVFLWTKSLMSSRRENCRKLITGTVIVLSGVLFYQIFIIISIVSTVKHAVQCEERGDNEQAISLYRKSLELNDTMGIKRYSTHSLISLGAILYQNGSVSESATCFADALKIDPGHPLALFGQSAAFYSLKGEKASMTELRKLARTKFSLEEIEETFSPEPALYHQLAIVLKENKKYSQALPLFQKNIESGFESGESEFHVGSIHFDRGNIDAAALHLEKAEQMEYPHPALFCQLGLIYSERKQWQKALEFGRRAISQSPMYLDVYTLLEKICTETGDKACLEQVSRSKKALVPQYSIAHRQTENVAFLGYSLDQTSYPQGSEITLFLYSKIVRNLEQEYEPMYLNIGNRPEVYFRKECNLLDGMISEKKEFYIGDVVISQCRMDGGALLPGLCDLTFFLPGDIQSDPRNRNKDITEVYSDRYRFMGTLSIVPEIHNRRTFGPHQIGHLFNMYQEQLYLEKYFLLANKYTIDVPLTYKPKLFLVDSLLLISTLSFGGKLDQNTTVAQLVMTDRKDNTYTWDIKAGRDTSDWAWDSPVSIMKHRRARPAYSWKVVDGGREFEGHKYYSLFSFPEKIQLKSMKMKYIANSGCIEVCDLILQGKRQEAVEQILEFKAEK